MPAAALNRRDWFRTFLGGRAPEPETAAKPESEVPMVAVIAGRNCLAYQNSFCSTCVERCPIEGAITTERGLPRIDPSVCTGCRVCADVCPAPVNAILLTPRRPSLAPIALSS